MINGKSGYFNIDIIQILVIFIIVYFATILLFRYLIKSNKIEASKVSRIFYTDDEKFIKDWKKNRKKHKLKYVLYNFIINSIVIFIILKIYSMFTGNEFKSGIFWGLLIGNVIGLQFRWNINEEKYYKLLNKNSTFYHE